MEVDTAGNLSELVDSRIEEGKSLVAVLVCREAFIKAA